MILDVVINLRNVKTITDNSLRFLFPLLCVKNTHRCPTSLAFFASIKEKIIPPLCYNLLITYSLALKWGKEDLRIA